MAPVERLRARIHAAMRDAGWQRRASVHWLGRYVARRQARRLFDLCAGFTYSQLLLACEQVDLLERLRAGPETLAALAEATATDAARLQKLCDGAAALQLLRRDGDRYALGALGAALLGNPGVRAMIAHHAHLYGDLADPRSLLNAPESATALSRFWSYAGSQAEGQAQYASHAPYTQLMADSQERIADQVLASMTFDDVERVLDLGGGQGVFVARLARRYPHLECEVLDLAPVTELATRYLAQQQLQNRVTVRSGDLFAEDFDSSADLITLVRVLHDHDDDAVLALLRRVRRAMRVDARLLVVEPLAEGPGSAGPTAYFAAYFLALGQGRLRRRSELQALLRSAGFVPEPSPRVPVPMLAQLQLARPTAGAV